MKKGLFAIFLCVTFNAQAQLTFYVYDKTQNIPIANMACTLAKKGFLEQSIYGVSSSNEGKITIPKMEFDKLHFKHLSYENEIIDKDKIVDTVYFQLKNYELEGVYITQTKAIDIVKKVVNNIDKNYPKEKYYTYSHYTQLHKEDTTAVRYIEAMLTTENQNYLSTNKSLQKTKYHIDKLRKSLVYEQNNDKHGDHLDDLLRGNPIQYLEENFLNPKKLYLYDWEIEWEKEKVLSIVFQNKAWLNDKNIQGSIIIDKQDYAIVLAEINANENPSYKREKPQDWTFKTSTAQYTFDKENNYKLSNAHIDYTHLVKNPAYGAEGCLIREYFTYNVKDYLKEASQNMSFSGMSNLYSLHQKYDENFWEDYKILPKIRKDLERKLPLEEQFNMD
ncbi:MAG: hypothetical protein KDE33_03715 [Bacteroidetes bacterium]|nr:hypothetical protein [Bacteroidota bacterium]